MYANFSDASNVPVNGYRFVSFSSSGGVTISANGTITPFSPGAFSISGYYDGLSVTANNIGTVTAYSAPPGTPAISVNIANASNPGMNFYDLSGAPGARSAYWNNLVVASQANVTNNLIPMNNLGTVQSATLVQWMPGSADSDNAVDYTYGPVTTNESVMFSSLFDLGMNNGFSATSKIVVSNVPYASYDAYFYFQNDNSSDGTNRPAQVTIDGVTQYRINSTAYPAMPDNNGNGYVQAAPQSGGLPASVADVPFGNYIKFSGLSDNVLNVTWGAVGEDYIGDAGLITRARLAGFQIVKSLAGLTATNLYLQSPVPVLSPGVNYSLSVLANFTDGTVGGNVTTQPGISYGSSNTKIFTVNGNGTVTGGGSNGVATLTITYQTNTLQVSVTNLFTQTMGSVIGLNLDSPTSQNYLYPADLAGAPGARVGNWNNLVAGANGSTADITLPSGSVINSSGGVVSGMSVVFHPDPNGGAVVNYGGSGGTNDPKMFLDYDDCFGGDSFTNYDYIDLTNIPYARYSIYCYAATDNSPGGSLSNARGGFWVITNAPGGSARCYIKDVDNNGNIVPEPDTNGNGYVQSTTTSIPAGGSSWTNIDGGNYVVFSNLTNSWTRVWFGAVGNGTGAGNTQGADDLGNYPTNGDSIVRFKVCGFQIVKSLIGLTATNLYLQSPVPVLSPGTNYALTVLADFTDGTIGGNVTSLPGIAYASSNTNIFSVNANGIITAGQTAGVATLTVTYQSNTLQASVTNEVQVSTTPVPMNVSVAGGALQLSWPPDHLGWQLETNAVGLAATNAWFPYPGSSTVTNLSVPVGKTGDVFFRLKYP